MLAAQLLPGELAGDEPPVPVAPDPGAGVDRDVGSGTVVGLRVVDGAGGATVVGGTSEDTGAGGVGTEDDVRGDEVAGEEVTGEEATEDAGPTDDGAGLVATEPGEPTGPAVAAVADPDAAVVPLP